MKEKVGKRGKIVGEKQEGRESEGEKQKRRGGRLKKKKK